MEPLIQVEAEELITPYDPPGNGSFPFWCYGSPPIVRDGEVVFVSVPETGAGIAPTCNTRAVIWARRAGAWRQEYVGARYDQREPCPIGRLPARRRFVADPSQRATRGTDPAAWVSPAVNRVLLSLNPAVAPLKRDADGRVWQYCEPLMLEMDADDISAPRAILKPRWDEPWPFTDHSYRGAAFDYTTGDMLVANIEGNSFREGYQGRYHWAVADTDRRWVNAGTLVFPVRACYPAVALRDRLACMVAVSDIDEPRPEWRARKLEVTGSAWDYDFRNLWIAWNRDVASGQFAPPILVDSMEETAGHIGHMDLALGKDGSAHVAYVRRRVWKTFLRDVFFAGLEHVVELVHAVVTQEGVVSRAVVHRAVERPAGAHALHLSAYGPWNPHESFRTDDTWPEYAGLHVGVDGALCLLYVVAPPRRLLALSLEPASEVPVVVPLSHVPSQFFVSGPRQGGEPGEHADLMLWCAKSPLEVRYAGLTIR